MTADSGFCPGATRALEIVERALAGGDRPVYSFGPIIHNPQEIARLSEMGLTVLDTAEENWPSLAGRTVILRAHGVDRDTEDRLMARGAQLIDSTCGNVKKAQRSAQKLLGAGWRVVLVGSSAHPEVQAITARAGGPIDVVRDGAEAARWLAATNGAPLRAGVTCQTTVAPRVLDEVVEVLRPGAARLKVKNTICPHMSKRWREAEELAGRVPVMIVVGGEDSSNTATLADACRRAGAVTHQVECEEDVRPQWLEGAGAIGVTGGASTPRWVIDRVVERLRAPGR